jgi:ribonuclease HI
MNLTNEYCSTFERDIIIYTDGSCNQQTKIGGWGAIIIEPITGFRKEISGKCTETTNNKMEIMAAIKALECLKPRSNVIVFTDSAYLIGGMSGNKRVKNKDLFRQLDQVSKRHNLMFIKVVGHSGNKGNQIADELARKAKHK